ncbi:MAG: RICIN domain-containing protein [Bacteroidales bacterium]|jgi:hypothetical protein|nr:RICIN domain-containing protein [Bacteroidales bacterium]
MKTIIIILLTLIIPIVFFSPRVCKDIRKKQNFANTYAIQNVGTGKDIRVYNAGIENNTKIILYSHKNWECITWQFIELQKNTYLLKNLYTQKTFQPSANLKAGVGLWQQELGGSYLQYWEFIEQPDKTYFIRLKDTELYLTATSNENNSAIILMPKQNSKNQLWKLIRQNPIV